MQDDPANPLTVFGPPPKKRGSGEGSPEIRDRFRKRKREHEEHEEHEVHFLGDASQRPNTGGAKTEKVLIGGSELEDLDYSTYGTLLETLSSNFEVHHDPNEGAKLLRKLNPKNLPKIDPDKLSGEKYPARLRDNSIFIPWIKTFAKFHLVYIMQENQVQVTDVEQQYKYVFKQDFEKFHHFDSVAYLLYRLDHFVKVKEFEDAIEGMDGFDDEARTKDIMFTLYLFDFKYKCVYRPSMTEAEAEAEADPMTRVSEFGWSIAQELDTKLKDTSSPSLSQVKTFLKDKYIEPVQKFLRNLSILYKQQTPFKHPFDKYLGYFIIMYFSDNFNIEGKKRDEKQQYVHPHNNPYLQIFQLYHNMENPKHAYNAFITLLEGLYDNFIACGVSSNDLDSLFWCKYMLYVRNAKNFYYPGLYGPVTNNYPYSNWDLKKLNNKKSDNDDELVKLKNNLFKIIQAAHPCIVVQNMYMSIPNSVYNAVEEKLRMIANNKCKTQATATADCGGPSNVASEVEKAATVLIQLYMNKAKLLLLAEQPSFKAQIEATFTNEKKLPYSTFLALLLEPLVQKPEFRERIWSDITKADITTVVNNMTTLIKDDICDLLTWAMEIVHKQSDIASDLPTVKHEFCVNMMSSYYGSQKTNLVEDEKGNLYLPDEHDSLKIDIRQFPKIIKIEFPQLLDDGLTKLIKSVFVGWRSLSFCEEVLIDNYDGLKTIIILWVQWMKNPKKSAPKFESADIPFYISIKKIPSEQRYIISFTNAIFETVSNLDSLQSGNDAFNMIEEEIKKELKQREIPVTFVTSNVFVVLGKNIKSTANKFPGQVELLANLDSNKFYIRARTRLESPNEGDDGHLHSYYYWTIAGNGKDYKCATFSEYWKKMLTHFGNYEGDYASTQTGAGNLTLPTYNEGIETDIRKKGDFFDYSSTLLEIINYHKFSGDQLQRLICIAYSYLNHLKIKTAKNIKIDKDGLLVGTIGSFWFTQDKSTTFGAFIEVASCLKKYVKKYNDNSDSEIKKRIYENLKTYLECLPIIIKPICFNHPIATEDKCKETPMKYLYPLTPKGAINHSSDQGKDVKDFHTIFADQWEEMMVKAKKGYIQADDNDFYYTGNLAFDFGLLAEADTEAKIIDRCTNFYQRVFSGNFESYFK